MKIKTLKRFARGAGVVGRGKATFALAAKAQLTRNVSPRWPRGMASGSLPMAKQAKDRDDEVDADVLTAEINRLVYSAKLRIEQQRIHIQELSGSITERTKAEHELRWTARAVI
jgi:hypothetical protein